MFKFLNEFLLTYFAVPRLYPLPLVVMSNNKPVPNAKLKVFCILTRIMFKK